MLKSVGVFLARIVGVLIIFAAAVMLIDAAVRNLAPTARLSCSSPEVVEGARTVFFKALVVDAFGRLGGQNDPDLLEAMEVAVGKCVDDLASDYAKSAECASWVKALNLVHLVHIRTARHLDEGDSCRSDGFTDVGPVVWEFEYVFKSKNEDKSFYIAGRLTGQWHLKPGMKI